MVNIRQLLKNWESTPPFSEYIPLETFIDGRAFRTKSGQVGVMLSVKGIDYESIVRQQLDSFTARLERAMQLFEPGTRVYQYFFRSSRPEIPHRRYSGVTEKVIGYRLADLSRRRDDLYESHTYLAVLLDISQVAAANANPLASLLSSFSSKKTIAVSLEAQSEALARLMQQVNTFIATTEDFADVQLLRATEVYSVFRALLNPDPLKRSMRMMDGAMEYPAYFAADSNFRAHETHLELDDYFVRVLTLKALPHATQPNLLKALRFVPGNYHIVSMWAPEYQHQTEKHADAIIGHNDATKQRTTLTPKRQLGPTRVKKSKESLSDALEGVGEEIVVNDKRFGMYSLTVVVYDRDPEALERTVAAFITASQTIGVTLITETDFANLAFLAIFPGGHKYNQRAKRISESNHADLSFFYALDNGDRYCSHLQDEYWAPFTSQNDELFYFNLHSGENGHTSIIAPPGMGKSFLCNYFIAHSTKYNPYITIIDLGGSYEYTTQLLGGNYVNIANSERNFKLNPFRLEATPENLDFLTAFVCALIEESGARLDDKEKNEIFKKIEQLYAIENPSLRTLSTLSRTLPERLSDRLHRWLDGGQYGHVFDNPEGADSLTINDVQTFNFSGFDEKKDGYLQHLFFYVLYRASQVIYDDAQLGRLKVFLIDEAFRVLKNQTMLDFFLTALTTWRKRNGTVIFATQAAGHLEKLGVLEDVATACATKIFLSNPSVDAARYAEVFKMPLEMAEKIRTLAPKRELLSVKDPDPAKKMTDKTAKILRLEVSPKERWLYANSARENVIRREALHRFNGDLDAALEYLSTNPAAQGTSETTTEVASLTA